MNPLTHKLLADRIYMELNKERKAEKNIIYRSSLVWGSLRPDFIREPVPHFRSKWKKPFYNKYNEFINLIPKLNPKEFSCELGQIFHYLCDYFCQAHNREQLMISKKKHVLNEVGLQRFATNVDDDFFLIKKQETIISDTQSFVDREYQQFKQAKFSFENDLWFAFKICVLLGRKVKKYYLYRRKISAVA